MNGSESPLASVGDLESEDARERELVEDVVVEGRYVLAHRIAQNATAVVWEALDRVLERPVALKLVTAAAARDPEDRRRFEERARSIAKLRSGHVVQIHDCGLARGVPFMVMERLVGEDLQAVLRRTHRLSVEAVSKIAREVGLGLEAIHVAGLVHGDLRPSNIFVARLDQTEIVKIIDLTGAHVAGAGERARSLDSVESPFYVSPEQLRGETPVDFRSDLWAFGAILYRALTGAQPHEGDPRDGRPSLRPARPPSVVVPELGPAFDAFFEAALAPAPEDRFQDIAAMVAAFRKGVTATRSARAWGGGPSAPRTTSTDERRSRPSLLLTASARTSMISGVHLKADDPARSEYPTMRMAAVTLHALCGDPDGELRSSGLRLRRRSTEDTPRAVEPVGDLGRSSEKITTAPRRARGWPTVLVAALTTVGVVSMGLAATRVRTRAKAARAAEDRVALWAPLEMAPSDPPVASAIVPVSADDQARAALERLQAGLSTCIKGTIHTLPGSSPAVPQRLAWLSLGPYASTRQDWASPVFHCAGFSIDAPMPFAIQWQAEPRAGRGTGVAWVGFSKRGGAERAYAFTMTVRGDNVSVTRVEPIDPSRPIAQAPGKPERGR